MTNRPLRHIEATRSGPLRHAPFGRDPCLHTSVQAPTHLGPWPRRTARFRRVLGRALGSGSPYMERPGGNRLPQAKSPEKCTDFFERPLVAVSQDDNEEFQDV